MFFFEVIIGIKKSTVAKNIRNPYARERDGGKICPLGRAVNVVKRRSEKKGSSYRKGVKSTLKHTSSLKNLFLY